MKFNYNGEVYNLNLQIDDEKGAGGIWDLAGEVAVNIGLEAQRCNFIPSNETVYAEDFGQDEIYKLIRDLVLKLS